MQARQSQKENFIMTKQNISRRVDTLMGLSTIVRSFMAIKRATIVDGRYESDGEHTLHLQFLAVSYAARYHPSLDVGLVSLYALVHDFVEVYAKDTPTLLADADALKQKVHREEQALLRLQGELGADWSYFIKLVTDYELLLDPEARFVRCFDKCDPVFSHFHNRGEALRKLGIYDEATYRAANEVVKKRILRYSGEFEDVLLLREELEDRVVKTAYPAV